MFSMISYVLNNTKNIFSINYLIIDIIKKKLCLLESFHLIGSIEFIYLVYFVHLLYLLFKKYNNSLMIIYIIYRLMIKISYDKNF